MDYTKVDMIFNIVTGRMKDKLSDKYWTYKEYRELLSRVIAWCEQELTNK